MIHDSLRWTETPCSFTSYITHGRCPSLEVRRETVTLCMIPTEVVGRCGFWLVKLVPGRSDS